MMLVSSLRGFIVNVIISARRVEDVQKNDNDIKPVDNDNSFICL